MPKSIRISTLVLAVACGGLGLFRYFSGVPGMSSDDFMRVYLAAKWAQEPVLVQFGNWPPLYSVFYGSVFKFGGNVLTLAHVLTSVLCVLILFLSVRLVFEFSQNIQAAWLALVLIALNPLYHSLCVSTLSEPLFVVLALGFIFSLYFWRSQNDRRWLWASTLLCILLTMTRTEGTPIAGAYALFILWKERNRFALLHALMACAFPVFWVAILWKTFGPLSELLNAYKQDSSSFYASNPYWNWIPTILLGRHFALACVVVPMGLMFWKRLGFQTKEFLFVSLFFLGAQLFLLWNRVSTVFPDRTIFFPGIFLLMASTLILFDLFRIWNLSRIQVRLCFSVLFVLVLMSWTMSWSRIQPQYSQTIARVGHLLSQTVHLQKAIQSQWIASDLDQARFGVLSVLSSFPERFVQLKYDKSQDIFFVQHQKTPQYFVLESEDSTKALQRQWRTSKVVKLDPLFFISQDSKAIQELN